MTGRFSGHVYGVNVDWLSLSNAIAYVQTDSVLCPDTDGDGIADAYEIRWTGGLTMMNETTDHDSDGVWDRDEYVTDTNPTDAADYLRIIALNHANTGIRLAHHMGEQAHSPISGPHTRGYRFRYAVVGQRAGSAFA